MNNEPLVPTAFLASLFLSCIEPTTHDESNSSPIGPTTLLSLLFNGLSGDNIDITNIQKVDVDKGCMLQVLLSRIDRPFTHQDLESLLASIQGRASTRDYKLLAQYQHIEKSSATESFIITLIGESITTAFVSSIVALLQPNHALLCSIKSLNNGLPSTVFSQNHEPIPLAYELSIQLNDTSHVTHLKACLLELATESRVDIAIQPDNILRKQKRLACFDMDSTLIQAEVIDELAKEVGMGQQVAEITESAMQGNLNFNQSFIQRIWLLEGLDESVLEKVAKRLVLSDGVETLFASLNRLGYKTAILSGGFDYFGRFLQKKLGIDYVYANALDITEGKVTGKVRGEIINGDKKAALLKMIAEKENIALEQVIAVGDGANDLPMLAAAGLGVAYKAKPLVKASAEHSINYVGLDGLLYMLGLKTQDIDSLISK